MKVRLRSSTALDHLWRGVALVILGHTIPSGSSAQTPPAPILPGRTSGTVPALEPPASRPVIIRPRPDASTVGGGVLDSDANVLDDPTMTGQELLPPPVPPPPPPRVLSVEPLPAEPGRGIDDPAASHPKVLRFDRDSTGLIPGRPPGPPSHKPNDAAAREISGVIHEIQGPQGEIGVAIGDSKLIQSRRPLSRVVVANPRIADVELISDQPESRILNVFGKGFGTTSLTLWDNSNRSVSFVIRVTLDTKELEGRINQTFPGATVKVRQVGGQVILEGQVPDSKTMADVLQVVQLAVRTSGGLQGSSGTGGAGGMSMGMSGGMSGTSGGGMGGAGAFTIVNRVVVPGPRQVLLHVKIAELNRNATRELGISWINAKGESILGSPIGGSGAGSVAATSTATHALSANPQGILKPLGSTFNSTATAQAGGELFGIFDAGHFGLFIHALRTNAMAKILAEPNLMALDGQPARFLVGGLFPFPVPQSSSVPGGTAVVTVQFRRFGTILNFIPQILPNDVIRLDVEPVISQLNFPEGTNVNGGRVPAIDERSARTVVELREGQTLAIAGLLQLTTTAFTQRVPGLGDLPIVGPWFSFNHIETIETETIVLVTPELVAPLEKHEITEAPGDRVYQPSDAEFYFLGRIEGKLGREFRASVSQQDPLNLMRHFQSERQWVIGPHGHAD